MPIVYSFSGDYEEYKHLLWKCTLDDLLININKKAADIFKEPDQELGYGVSQGKYTIYNKLLGNIINQPLLFAGRDMIDLAYNAIIASNDFRGK